MANPTRICGRCKIERPVAMFYLRVEAERTAREGRKSPFKGECRLCQRDRQEARIRPRRDYSDAIKLASGCVDCGIRSEHPEIYDLDHRPGVEKVTNVAALLTRGTFEDFKAEIEKCDVVCANCHRIRTRARGHNAFGKSRGPQTRRTVERAGTVATERDEPSLADLWDDRA